MKIYPNDEINRIPTTIISEIGYIENQYVIMRFGIRSKTTGSLLFLKN
jgi:hypothetical protein